MSLPYYLGNNLSDNHKLYVDSISLQFILLTLGIRNKRVSGVGIVSQVEDWSNILVLGPCLNSNIQNHLNLPYWNSLESVSLNELDISYISKFDVIFLAISSPKQDRLSVLMESTMESKEIHCLGAALNTGSFYGIIDRIGFNWLLFLFSNPKRFISKIDKTIRNITLAYKNRDRLVDLFENGN